jgi:uncharacterized protein YndB with AHSA1/START domain
VALDITAEALINAPPDRVFAYAIDPANEREWIGGLQESRQLTDGPVRIGTQVERVAKFMARRIVYVNEVTELEPGRVLVMRSVKAPFPMAIAYRFEDVDGATRMTNRVSGGPGGLTGLLGPLMALGVKRNVSRDLKRLKAILEQPETNRQRMRSE